MATIVRVAIGVVCFFGFTLAALLFLAAVNPWVDQHEIPFLGSRSYDSALCGVAGLFCVFAGVRLIQGKLWAWWIAFAVSLATVGLGIFLFVSALHPRDDFARSESGFGLGTGLILMTLGAITSVLLGLPPVRRKFFLKRVVVGLTLGRIAFAWAIFLWGAALVLPQLDSHTRTHPAVKAIVAVVYALFLIGTSIALATYFNRAWRRVGTVPNRTAYVVWLSLESIAGMGVLGILAYSGGTFVVAHFR
jgi:hypothetical protein